MYEVFKDLLKVADEMVDVTICSLNKDGEIYIEGIDAVGTVFSITLRKQVDEIA